MLLASSLVLGVICCATREERLKVVVCTSSLDLGVDFNPVECLIILSLVKNPQTLFAQIDYIMISGLVIKKNRP